MLLRASRTFSIQPTLSTRIAVLVNGALVVATEGSFEEKRYYQDATQIRIIIAR